MFDRKFLRKRIVATSPMIDILLPFPKDGKARAIIAKKQNLDCINILSSKRRIN